MDENAISHSVIGIKHIGLCKGPSDRDICVFRREVEVLCLAFIYML